MKKPLPDLVGDDETLTDTEIAFADAYIRTNNGALAAREVGYIACSARVKARAILARPHVGQYIQRKRAEMMALAVGEVTPDRVMAELAGIAFADVNELIESLRGACRHCYGIDFGYQYTKAEMKKARAEHERNVRSGLAQGEFDPQGGEGYDPGRKPFEHCPECHGEGDPQVHLNDSRDLSAGARALYAGIKTGPKGIEVKLHDKQKALELIGKQIGMFKNEVSVDLSDLTKAILDARARTG